MDFLIYAIHANEHSNATHYMAELFSQGITKQEFFDYVCEKTECQYTEAKLEVKRINNILRGAPGFLFLGLAEAKNTIIVYCKAKFVNSMKVRVQAIQSKFNIEVHPCDGMRLL